MTDFWSGFAVAFARIDSRREPDGCAWCDGCDASRVASGRWGGMARKTYAAAQSVCGLVPWIGFLFDHGAALVDVRTGVASSASAGAGARAVSHCEFLWAVCSDDARALRDRISGLAGWEDVDCVSVSLQAAGD